MCIIAIDDLDAVCEIDGVKRAASLMMLDDAQVGDYVLIHAGFAIEKLDLAEAQETLRIFRDYLAEGGTAT
jgi:hydrogenase expression/formation protein HypC